ncbi:MAG: MarR family winged helix-turn-helix transcriptional regulator [bacterium]
MKSVFHLDSQHDEIDDKIAATLERLSQAYRVLLWEQNKKYNLSPIQIQLLVHLLHHSKDQAKVGSLAREFSLTPATISDAINTLATKSLVRREKNDSDRRSVTIVPTAQGKRIARQLSTWADAIRESISGLADKDKPVVMKFLMQLIASLQRDGLITVARMCITCKYFKVIAKTKSKSPYYCTLLEKPFVDAELRFDCQEHEMAI